MTNITLKLEERLTTTAGKVKKLRTEGYVPGVIYGKDIDSKPIKIKASDLRSLLTTYGKSALVNAIFEDGKSFPAFIKDIQYGILKDEYISIDLHQVSMTEKVRTSVPIRIIGRESVERGGGIVAQQLDSVEVECLPQDAPQYIELDISHMTSGQSLTAGELSIPEPVVLITEPEQLVLSITSGKSDTTEEPEESEQSDNTEADAVS